MTHPDLAWLHPALNLPAAVLALALACYLLVGEPLLGRRMYRRLQQQRDRDPNALLRFLRQTMGFQAGFVAVTLACLALAPGLHARHLGLAWPAGPLRWQATGFTAYLVVIILVMGLAMRVRARRGRSVPGQAAFSAMLPRTRAERWHALAVAVGAGVSEELAFRGLLIATGVALFGVSPYVAAAALIVLFGVAHLYQGVGGMVGTALVGALLTGLYLASGSLLLPIVLHVVIDIRSLLLVPAPRSAPTDPGTATVTGARCLDAGDKV
ncbi:CPBP family intramembrane metalloprotease [Planosporangium thailandense]|uniref:CPBP family intramembrane metalloprotease n=1 Tax=Planosporangium thailandense TaxID=765197 RepID=A0ABX0XUE1_9ACTN|nr:CPBP family intramembrane metalloprotease [Planosporangium thailandense]